MSLIVTHSQSRLIECLLLPRLSRNKIKGNNVVTVSILQQAVALKIVPKNHWYKSLDPILRDADSFGLEWDPIICISTKLPDNVDGLSLWSTLRSTVPQRTPDLGLTWKKM